MIAVTFALPAESSRFVQLLRNGRLHGDEVRVLHTGVGTRVAAARFEEFLERTTPRILISGGFAGALTDDLRVGNLLVAENFSARELVFATRAMTNLRLGKLVTADIVADSPAQREELARATGALAVDMETEAIARVCRSRSVPMLSLRAISDTPSAPFGIPARVLFDLESQRTKAGRLAGYLLTHPAAVKRLLMIVRQVRVARDSLTAALDEVLRELPR